MESMMAEKRSVTGKYYNRFAKAINFKVINKKHQPDCAKLTHSHTTVPKVKIKHIE